MNNCTGLKIVFENSDCIEIGIDNIVLCETKERSSDTYYIKIVLKNEVLDMQTEYGVCLLDKLEQQDITSVQQLYGQDLIEFNAEWYESENPYECHYKNPWQKIIKMNKYTEIEIGDDRYAR